MKAIDIRFTTVTVVTLYILGDDSVNNVNSPQPPRPPSVASSHGSETPVARKSTAKATLKLAVLYQPESPERREFIDFVIKFHEDKGQPLKGPPMFNQQPLDLFELYNLVKKRGGMNEVRLLFSFSIHTFIR